MNAWARRIRGAIGMGLAWAAAGFGAGIVLARASSFNPDLPFALLFAPLGFLSGLIFSAVLMALERRRGFDRLSILRFAAWGAASGLLLSGVLAAGAALRGASALGEFLLFGPALGTAGAACAASSLALAKRPGNRELPSAGVDSPEVELTESEKRVLPGRDD